MGNVQRAGARNALGIFGKVIEAIGNGELVYLAFYNVLWFLSCLPVVTIPPATAALYVATRDMVQNDTHVGWREFGGLVWDNFRVGWRWAVMNLVIGLIFSVNLWFYSSITNFFTMMLAAMLTGFLWAWIIVQMYCFPVLLEQKNPSLRQALRNAFVLCAKYPSFTFTLAIFTAIFLLIAYMLPFFVAIFSISVVTFIYNHAVYFLVELERGEGESSA
jgi:uncharacterized membrane protein YesL